MLGEKLYDITGQITGQRVLRGEGFGDVQVEVSFQGTGKVLGLDTLESGTYVCQMLPNGTLKGDGQGLSLLPGGEMLTWHGSGIGKPTGKGMAASWRGSTTFCTNSQRLAQLNGIVTVFEWEVDESGRSKGTSWQWK